MIRTIFLGVGGAVLVLLLAVAGTGNATAHALLFGWQLTLPTALVVAISLLVGGFMTWAMSIYAAPAEERRRIGYAALLPAVGAGAALLLLASIPAIAPARAAAGLLLGTLALTAGIRCVERLAAGETIGFESHWGGLGGGTGGWRLFPAAALGLLALAFAGGALTVLVAEPAKEASPPSGAKKAGGTGAHAGGASAAAGAGAAAENVAEPANASAPGNTADNANG